LLVSFHGGNYYKIMTKNILMSFVLLVTVAASRFLITLTIARHWSKTDVGLFSLIISLTFLVSAFALLGQNLGIIRFFSKQNIVEYNWKKYLIQSFAKGTIISLLGSIIAGYIFRFNTTVIIICAVITTCILVQEYCSSIFRANHKYYVSIIIGQFLPVVFLCILFFHIMVGVASLQGMLIWYVLVSFVYTVICMRYTFMVFSSGDKILPSSMIKQGYILFGVAITFVLFNQADVMLVAGLMNVESLAVYAVIMSIMKVYDFAGMALNHVLLPKIHSLSSKQIMKMTIGIVLTGLAVSIAYLCYGKELIQILYKGKYDNGVFLLPVFCMAGMLKLVYTVPSSFISAVSSEQIMKAFMYVNIVAVVINYASNVYLIYHYGILGAALGAVVAWAIRVGGAYALTAKHLLLPQRSVVTG